MGISTPGCRLGSGGYQYPRVQIGFRWVSVPQVADWVQVGIYQYPRVQIGFRWVSVPQGALWVQVGIRTPGCRLGSDGFTFPGCKVSSGEQQYPRVHIGFR